MTHFLATQQPSGFLNIIEIMLIIFMVFFVGVVVWLFVFRRRKHYTEHRKIPLNDDIVVTPHHNTPK